jgi:enoyl-CoA hydratase
VSSTTGVPSAGHLVAPSGDVPLLVSQRGDVRWLLLNRPGQRNALNPAMTAALDDAIAEAGDDPATRLVVIAGEGKSFCAGADLRHLQAVAEAGGDPAAFLSAVSDCFTRLECCAKPVVAAVHGHVVAGGLELALACDVVVARDGTLIGDGHVRNGLLPAGGASVRLPRKVGAPLARWLLLTGELLPAEAFVASGFIHAIAPAEQFDNLVATVVDSLREPQRAAQTRMKQLLTGGPVPDAAALAHELDAFARHWHSQDIARDLQAFFSRNDDRRDR